MIVVPSCQIVSVGKYSNVILPSVSIGKSSSSIKAFPCQDNALHWNAMFFFIILIDKIEYPLTYLYITEVCRYTRKCLSTKVLEGNIVLSEETIFQKNIRHDEAMYC